MEYVRYDLKKMLEEIKEDEALGGKDKRQSSQEDIRRMIMEKQKKKRAENDQ